MKPQTQRNPCIKSDPFITAFSSCALLFVLIALFFLSSCYDPEPYEPKEYLEPEVYVKVGNSEWEEISKAEFTLDFQSNYFEFDALHMNHTITIGCRIRGKNEAKLFKYYTSESSLMSNYADAIREVSYKTNDTITAIFHYHESKDGGSLTDSDTERNRWDSADPKYNEMIIEEVLAYENQMYLSGSFTAGVYRSYDNKLTPAYQFYEGTFKNVRVTKIYHKQ